MAARWAVCCNDNHCVCPHALTARVTRSYFFLFRFVLFSPSSFLCFTLTYILSLSLSFHFLVFFLLFFSSLVLYFLSLVLSLKKNKLVRESVYINIFFLCAFPYVCWNNCRVLLRSQFLSWGGDRTATSNSRNGMSLDVATTAAATLTTTIEAWGKPDVQWKAAGCVHIVFLFYVCLVVNQIEPPPVSSPYC